MSIELDPKEVLMCLNQLGYYNISSKQLKEFLKDLKTLIKHDIKKLTKQNQENISPYSSHDIIFTATRTSSTSTTTKNDIKNNNINEQNIKEVIEKFDEVKQKVNEVRKHVDEVKSQPIPHKKVLTSNELFEHLYSTSTASTRAKSIPKFNSVISIDIRKTKKRPEVSTSAKNPSEHTKSSSWTTVTTDTKSEKISTIYVDSEAKTNVESKSTSSKDCCCIHNINVKKSHHICSCIKNDNSRKSIPNSNELKPKVSFIKPRRPIKTFKSDPVSLYQQYQKEWKKVKIPGEDKRFDLRWAIRERMLGEPELPVHPLDKKKSTKF